MAPVRRTFMYDKKPYSLMISPAYLEDRDGKLTAHLP